MSDKAENFYVWKNINNPKLVYATRNISIYKYFDKKILKNQFKVFVFDTNKKQQNRYIDLFDLPKEIDD